MKKLLFIALMLASFASYAQPQFGGQVGGYDNSGTKKFLMFKGGEAKYWDSTANVYNLAQKLKLDSLYSLINTTIYGLLGNIDANTANISTWADNNTLPIPATTGYTPVSSGWQMYGLVSTGSPTHTTGRLAMPSFTEKGGTRVTLIDSIGNCVSISGGSGGGLSKFTAYDTVGSVTSMTVTNLNSLASSATVGWQSDKIDNITSTKATDYRIFVKATMSNTAPANDKTLYVYAAPFYYDGSTWQGPSLGTTSQATGTQGSCTIASAAPNNLVLLGVLSYSTQNMVLQSTFNLSNAFGRTLPDGFSIVITNYTGSAISASGNVVSYKPVFVTNR